MIYRKKMGRKIVEVGEKKALKVNQTELFSFSI
jgi:hypothetical protein